MKTKLGRQILAVTITIISFILVFSPVFADETLDNSEYPYCCHDSQSNWSRGRYSGSRYDLNQVETLDGEVISIDVYTSRRGTWQGVHLMVNTGKETLDVHLAPSWYLKERNFEITPKDKIAITGSRINLDGEQAVIAREIKKGDRTLLLRNENGFPIWRGWQQ